MRKFSIVLVFCILAPLLVSPLRQVIFQCRTVMLSGMSGESEKLELLVFTKEEFHRLPMEREGREFRFQGYLYDIKAIESSGENLKVLALRDKPETMLLLALNQLEGTGLGTAQGRSGLVFIPYFHDIPALHTPEELTCSQILYPDNPVAYTEGVVAVDVPPPELLIW